MAKVDDTGIFRLENGCYAYRIVRVVNGKRRDTTRRKDKNGNLFHTKAQARADRDRLKLELNDQNLKGKKNLTVEDVWNYYLENGSSGKAYSTIKKQKSLWTNHISKKFGNRTINSLTVGEINDYLKHLYIEKGLSYAYVESFIKFFYLILGTAQNYDFIEPEHYRKMCINKPTKIKMPSRKVGDDEEEVRIFSREELKVLDNTFLDDTCNAKVAYALGRYAGLRVNEAYGLKWENVDFKKKEIRIDRQMQYEEKVWKLVPPKTHAGVRTIEMCDALIGILIQQRKQLKNMQKNHKEVLAQNAKYILDVDGKRISSLELVNCTPEGKLQTINSMKYWAKKINKEELDVEAIKKGLAALGPFPEEYKFYTVVRNEGVQCWDAVESITQSDRKKLIDDKSKSMGLDKYTTDDMMSKVAMEVLASHCVFKDVLDDKYFEDDIFDDSVEIKKLYFKFHWLRHTFCSQMAAAGVPVTDLCRIAGHSKIETTYRYYTNRTEKSTEKVLSAMDEL